MSGFGGGPPKRAPPRSKVRKALVMDPKYVYLPRLFREDASAPKGGRSDDTATWSFINSQLSLMTKLIEVNNATVEESKSVAAVRGGRSGSVSAPELKSLVATSEAGVKKTGGFMKKFLGRKEQPETPVSSVDDLPDKAKALLKRADVQLVELEDNDKFFKIAVNLLNFVGDFRLVHADLKAISKPPSDAVVKEAAATVSKIPDSVQFKKMFGNQRHVGGPSSRVYEADTPDKMHVAIKKLRHDDPDQVKRNLAQVEVLSRIQRARHANIVRLVTTLSVKTDLWLVMEHLDGGTLREALNTGAFKDAVAAYITFDVLKALQYLHANNLVHRNLCLSNIMLCRPAVAKLIDFGEVLDINDTGPENRACGVEAYIAPELLRGEAIDTRADIYSLGVVVEFMLRGRETAPADAKNRLKLTWKQATDRRRLIRKDKVSPEVRSFLKRTIADLPDDRSPAKRLMQTGFIQSREKLPRMRRFVHETFYVHNLNNQAVAFA